MKRAGTLDAIAAAAGATDPGRQRHVNEDRFHIDETRGLFIVIDGVGGQAAGGRAADIALSMLRGRLERETGSIPDRIREAITVANNEIYRLASSRPEWDGMACVLTVAVVKDGVATIGHVGDTRLYRIRRGDIEKVTCDHSPVGEREDAQELSELEAMRHPRRNEVYRDVGSELHAPGDPEFIDVVELPFEPGDALLLCSDGLTDLVDSATILRTVMERAGQPRAIARALVDAANAAGGKDNVTVVFAEGGTFAASGSSASLYSRRERPATAPGPPAAVVKRRQLAAAVLVVILVGALVSLRTVMLPIEPAASTLGAPSTARPTEIVRSGQSIAAALSRARPGTDVLVEPGEYRERVVLDRSIRLVSRVPRGATIRPPAGAGTEPAITARATGDAELVGFRIVGDTEAPLSVGVLVAGSSLTLLDVEVSGATTAAVAFTGNSRATLVGSDIHDNPGAALEIEEGASPRILHNVFRGNGLPPQSATFAIGRGATPLFDGNVFVGLRPGAFGHLDEPARLQLHADNWFLSAGSTLPGERAATRAVPGAR